MLDNIIITHVLFSDNAWRYTYAPMSRDAFAVDFIASVGTGYQSDIAIDDVLFTREPCPQPPTPGSSPIPPTPATTFAPGINTLNFMFYEIDLL